MNHEIAGLLVCGAILLAAKLPGWLETRRAATQDARDLLVYKRKAEHYQAIGHAAPRRAAEVEIGGTIEKARFRAFACDEYVRTGRRLDDIRQEWWKSAVRRMLDVQSIGRSRAEAAAYVKAVEVAIFRMDEESVYVEGEAEAKWKEECKLISDANQVCTREDPVARAVMDKHWENLRNGTI